MPMERTVRTNALDLARQAIHSVAEEHGTTEQEVREEMMNAMRAGMDNPDPKIRAMWDAIPRVGPEPTVEEFIAWAAAHIQSK